MNPPSPVSGPTLWPRAIVAAFAVFILGTAGLIVFSLFHRQELVAADYYEQDLRHQEQIERVARTQPFRDQVRVAYVPARQQMQIGLPLEHARQRPTGRIQLYRPSAAGQDRQFDLDLDLLGHQSLDARDLAEGLWRVRIHWTVDGEEFAIEERVVIAPGVRQ